MKTLVNVSIFEPFSDKGLHLSNRLVMAPMTRNRAIGNIPNEMMAEYYGQRASAGLIITEGVSPSPNGLGYARIPGIFSAEQIEGWKKVTAAVHDKGGKIFIQLMHTGRVSHTANMPVGARILAPSAIAASGEIWTDTMGMQPMPVPAAMTTEEVKATIAEYVSASKNAIAAGFDGVELHGANGYLIEQFIRPTSNSRTDEYGGTAENYARFAFETTKAVAEAIGKEKTAIRLSPYGVFNDMPYDTSMDDIYETLVTQLNELGIVYIHLLDHSPIGAPEVPDSIKEMVRNNFNGILIFCGGYDADRAQQEIDNARADLIAVGRLFLANPDLVYRWKNGMALNDPDFNTFYTPGEKGYTDYPTLSA